MGVVGECGAALAESRTIEIYEEIIRSSFIWSNERAFRTTGGAGRGCLGGRGFKAGVAGVEATDRTVGAKVTGDRECADCNSADGTDVRLWTWLNNDCQQWSLQP